MKKKILTKMLCAALMVSLTVPAFSVNAAQENGIEVNDGAGEDRPGIVPFFGPAGHIDRQCAYVAAQLNLNSQQRAAMEETARASDTMYGDVRGFHARKNEDGLSNYLANLKALDICARKIDKESDLENYVLSRLPNISAQDKNDVRQMVRTILGHFKDRNLTREQKRYMICGFGVHLTGDMFAHRTMLKNSTLANWDLKDTTSKKFFQTSDFVPETLSKFKSEIAQGKLCTVDMKPYMKSPVTAQIYKNGRWQAATRKGEVYIDNMYFMPNRMNACERTAASFVRAAFDTNFSFSDINYYLEDYNLKLENFAQYMSVL